MASDWLIVNFSKVVLRKQNPIFDSHCFFPCSDIDIPMNIFCELILFCDQLPDGLEAQLVEHCTGITGFMGLISV